MELVVDTGSAVTIIPEHFYKEHFSDVLLVEPRSRLVTYTRAEVPVLGCLPANVQYEHNTATATLYVVKTGTALLGLDLFKALRLCIDNNNTVHADPLPAASPPVAPAVELKQMIREIKAAPATEEKLGLAKGFVHCVKVREGVQPVQQKLRRLPLSVRQAVSPELERLLAMDVIERIDASPWVSPIVVTL